MVERLTTVVLEALEDFGGPDVLDRAQCVQDINSMHRCTVPRGDFVPREGNLFSQALRDFEKGQGIALTLWELKIQEKLGVQIEYNLQKLEGKTAKRIIWHIIFTSREELHTLLED